MKNVIALDPGYGNTKVCVNGATASIQSAVARPQSTGKPSWTVNSSRNP